MAAISPSRASCIISSSMGRDGLGLPLFPSSGLISFSSSSFSRVDSFGGAAAAFPVVRDVELEFLSTELWASRDVDEEDMARPWEANLRQTLALGGELRRVEIRQRLVFVPQLRNSIISPFQGNEREGRVKSSGLAGGNESSFLAYAPRRDPAIFFPQG